MYKTLWKFPVPTSAVLGNGVEFRIMHGREVGLFFEYEGEGDSIEKMGLVFGGVEAFKCTSQFHRQRCAERIRTAGGLWFDTVAEGNQGPARGLRGTGL